MDKLYFNIILNILNLLNNKDKIYFLSASKKLNLYKQNIFFYDPVRINKIQHLYYKKNFKNIIINYVEEFLFLHDGIEKIFFSGFFNENIMEYIPNSVIFLKFNRFFNQLIYYLPSENIKTIELPKSNYNKYLRLILKKKFQNVNLIFF